MIPSVGRIVQYTLTPEDAARAQTRYRDAVTAQADKSATGYVVHVGNSPMAGTKFPMVIVRVWGEPALETTAVNGQVFLDGNDSLWVTSVAQGDGEGTWREFPRV